MRYITAVVGGLLVGAALFSSCTCHKELAQPETKEFKQPPSGFVASGVKITPMRRVAAPTVTPMAAKPPQEEAKAAPAEEPPKDVPPDFPADMPIYKDASLSAIQDLANEAHQVVFKSGDSIHNIYDFYFKQLSGSGWNVTQKVQRPEHAFITFQKGDLIAHVTIAQDINNPGQQIIAIMYEHQKPLPFEEF